MDSSVDPVINMVYGHRDKYIIRGYSESSTLTFDETIYWHSSRGYLPTQSRSIEFNR